MTPRSLQLALSTRLPVPSGSRSLRGTAKGQYLGRSTASHKLLLSVGNPELFSSRHRHFCSRACFFMSLKHRERHESRSCHIRPMRMHPMSLENRRVSSSDVSAALLRRSSSDTSTWRPGVPHLWLWPRLIRPASGSARVPADPAGRQPRLIRLATMSRLVLSGEVRNRRWEACRIQSEVWEHVVI